MADTDKEGIMAACERDHPLWHDFTDWCLNNHQGDPSVEDKADWEYLWTVFNAGAKAQRRLSSASSKSQEE